MSEGEGGGTNPLPSRWTGLTYGNGEAGHGTEGPWLRYRPSLSFPEEAPPAPLWYHTVECFLTAADKGGYFERARRGLGKAKA
jgi:hypothetical protein